MKVKRAKHSILLQTVSDFLYWLEVKLEEEDLQVLGGGKISLLPPENDDSESEEETLSPEDLFRKAVISIQKQSHVGWMSNYEVLYIVPFHRMTARFLETPPTEDENIRELAAFEVAEALQVPIEEIAWDMHLSSRHGDEPEKQLLWTATREEFVDSILDSWPPNHLVPTQLTADLWAVYELILGEDETVLSDPAVIVSQEGEYATLMVADEKAIYYTRSVNLDRPSPGSGGAPVAEMKERVLALEIERTLSYASGRFPQGTIHTMVLCGFEDWALERIQEMANQRSLRVTRITLDDIKTLFQVADETALEQAHFSMLSIAYCRLDRELDGLELLDKGEESKSWHSYVPEAALPSNQFLYMAGGLAAAILALWIGNWIWFNSAVSSRLMEGQELIRLADSLHKEEIGLRQLSQTDVNYGDLFVFLSENLPSQVLVKSISLDTKTGVDLILTGGNNQTVVEIVDTLNKSKFFRNIVEERAVVEQDGFTVYLKGKLKLSS